MSERPAPGLVKCNYTSARMEDIHDVFDEMRAGKIDGRIVLEIGEQSPCELSGAVTKAE